MSNAIVTINEMKIITLNVNSLISHSKRHSVERFLQVNKPHVMLIDETKLNAKHILDFRHYSIVRVDRKNSRGGGTAVLIKEGIGFKPISTKDWNLTSIECAAVCVETDRAPIIVVAAYSTGNAGPLLTTELDTIFTLNGTPGQHSIVVGGDLNARHQSWGDNLTCGRGNALKRWCDTNAPFVRDVRTAQATFYRGNTSSFIDLFLVTDDIQVVHKVHMPGHLQIIDFDSDHRAVELNITLNRNLLAEEPIFVKNFGSTNWMQFRTAVDHKMERVECPADRNMTAAEIDAVLSNLTTGIVEAIDETVPKIKLNKNSQIPLTPAIISLIGQKKRLQRTWYRARHTANEQMLRSQLNCLRKIVRDAIERHYEHHWRTRLRNIRLDNQTFREIKKLSGRAIRKGLPEMVDPVTLVGTNDDEQKVAILARHFGAVHVKNANLGDPMFDHHVHGWAQELSNRGPACVFSADNSADPLDGFHYERHLVSYDNMKSIIRSRSNKNSAGMDEIPNTIIKKLPNTTIGLLVRLFNQMYNIAYFPMSWKCARIIPIPKKGGSTSEPGNYRPIALLPCLGKIFEVAIRDRINDHCIEVGIFPPDQFGFRAERNTTQALTVLTTDVTTKLNNRTPTIACLLDIEKAFDTVWHEGLVFKMNTIFGFGGHLCRMILNYLVGRTFVVTVDKYKSQPENVDAGAPQGGVLSATLYIVYVADIPEPPTEWRQIKRLQFADDMMVYVSTSDLVGGQNRLNEYIAKLVDYYTMWKIRINPRKSEAILFKGPGRNHGRRVNQGYRRVTITVDGTQVPIADSVKYLGVTLTKNMKFIRHVDETIAKANRALGAIRPIIGRMNGLSVGVKMLCYKQLIRPIIRYAAPVWTLIGVNQMNRIKLFERKCLRYCVNSRRHVGQNGTYVFERNDELYRKAGISQISDILVSDSLKYFTNMVANEGNLIDGIIELEQMRPDDEWKPPWYVVHLSRTGQPHPSGGQFILQN